MPGEEKKKANPGILDWIFDFFVSPIKNAIKGVLDPISGHPTEEERRGLKEKVESFSKLLSPASTHSPVANPGLTPDSEADHLEKYAKTGADNATSTWILSMIQEAVSFGQVDVSVAGYLSHPVTRAYYDIIAQIWGMEYLEGRLPYYRRWILKEFQPNLPNYQDMIGVYVREGYLEEKWVEIPPEFTEYMKELGYSEDWTKRLWGKHWVLPGVDLLYDMFHKKIIDYETLALMLKFHDFEPVWRDRLIKNAYALIPRVDLRRAYMYRIPGYEDLVEPYEKLGYSPEDAKTMDLIAKRFALERYHTRLETVARAAFRKRAITEAQLKDVLVKVNTPAAAIPLIIEAETLARGAAVVEPEEEPRVLTASQVVSLHRTGTLPYDAAKTRLVKMGFLSEDAELLLHLEPNRPSSADMRYMVEWNVIGLDALTKHLVDSGMDPEWAPKVAEAWQLNQLRDELAKVRRVYEDQLEAGFMSKADFAKELEGLHYAPHVIIALSMWADEELDFEEKKDLAKEYETLAKEGILTPTEYGNALRELGMVETMITRKQKHIERLLAIKAAKEAAKTKA